MKFVSCVQSKPIIIILSISIFISVSFFLNSLINFKNIPFCTASYQRKCTSCPIYANCTTHSFKCQQGYISDLKGKKCLKTSLDEDQFKTMNENIISLIKSSHVQTIEEVANHFSNLKYADLESLIQYENQYAISNDGIIKNVHQPKSFMFYLSLSILLILTLFLVMNIH